VVHWNGTQWSLVPSPNFGSDNSNYLYGVAVLRSEAAEGNVWAVGDVFASVRYPTLVLRYYDPCASAPNTATPLPTTAVSATGTATSTATGTATRTATRTPTSTPSNTVLATRTATGT